MTIELLAIVYMSLRDTYINHITTKMFPMFVVLVRVSKTVARSSTFFILIIVVYYSKH